MTRDAFLLNIGRMKITYGDKFFPDERVKLLWSRYARQPDKAFEGAVDWIIINMPPVNGIIGILDDKLRDEERVESKKNIFTESYTFQGNAKELADKYIPEIRKILKGGIGKPLPYNQNEQIADKEPNNFQEFVENLNEIFPGGEP